jgi:hypothetical protein
MGTKGSCWRLLSVDEDAEEDEADDFSEPSTLAAMF